MTDSLRNPARGTSVQADWRAWLPDAQAVVFQKNVRELESNYTILSISLNEAIELRDERHFAKSLEAVKVSSALCFLLADPLSGLLRALYDHAKHYGTIPNAAPLDPSNFHGQRSQKSARMSGLMNHVLLSHRLQFLHKISTLGEMVEDLATDFRYSATDLSNGASAQSTKMWEAVDADHYDLNTCLREAIVLLKSFLLVLPVDQLGAFQQSIVTQSKSHLPGSPASTTIRHRRTASIAGQ